MIRGACGVRCVVVVVLLLFGSRVVAQCDPEWQNIASGPRLPRSVAMAYDSARQEILTFSGFLGSEFPTCTWTGSDWSVVETASPPNRRQTGICFDIARGKMVAFGGDEPEYRNDTWEWNGSEWSFATTVGPSARHGHAMAYDAVRSRVVLFGGEGTFGVLGDTWEWDGVTWLQVATSGPAPRFGASMATDPTTGRVVLFGGRLFSNTYGDTWTWDGAAWILAASTGPSARYGAAMATDVRNQRVILQGGGDNSVYATDTWSWNGTTWALVPVSGPAAQFHGIAIDELFGTTLMFTGDCTTWVLRDQRWEPILSYRTEGGAWMEFDRARDQMVFLGLKIESPAPTSSTFVRTNDQWKKMLFTTPAPSPRSNPGMTWDGLNERVMIFGGNSLNGFMADAWGWTGDRWQRIPGSGPSPREWAAMAYDEVRHRIVLYGGAAGTVFDDTWEWDGASWSLRAEEGPGGLIRTAMLFDPAVGRVRLFGKLDSVNTMWTWDGNEWEFEGVIPAQAPLVAYDSNDDVFLMFGGNPSQLISELWEWDRSSWRRLPDPPSRYAEGCDLTYDPVRQATVLIAAPPVQFGTSTWEYRRDRSPRVLGITHTPIECVSSPVLLTVQTVLNPGDVCNWYRNGQLIPGEHETSIRLSAPVRGDFSYGILGECGAAQSPTVTVAPCAADFNCDGSIGSQDFFDFVVVFFDAPARADIDGDGQTTSQDFFDFLTFFFGGC